MFSAVLNDVPPQLLPKNGSYRGLWTGYKVRVQIGIYSYDFDASEGVRGMNVPCVVHVKDGEYLVEDH